MQRIRIDRRAPARDRWDRYAVLSLDPRDPDLVRAKHIPAPTLGVPMRRPARA